MSGNVLPLMWISIVTTWLIDLDGVKKSWVYLWHFTVRSAQFVGWDVNVVAHFVLFRKTQ